MILWSHPSPVIYDQKFCCRQGLVSAMFCSILLIPRSVRFLVITEIKKIDRLFNYIWYYNRRRSCLCENPFLPWHMELFWNKLSFWCPSNQSCRLKTDYRLECKTGNYKTRRGSSLSGLRIQRYHCSGSGAAVALVQPLAHQLPPAPGKAKNKNQTKNSWKRRRQHLDISLCDDVLDSPPKAKTTKAKSNE